MHATSKPDRRIDAALLVLRLAGLFLALTFGWQKISGLVEFIHTGQPFSTWGFGQFIRSLHFPFPLLLGLCAILSESISALLIALGLFTRLAAAFTASTMIVAFYVSLRLGEEPLRALLYCLIFATIAAIGPGRFSLGHVLRPNTSPRNQTEKTELLVLRIGAAACLVLLYSLRQSGGANFLAVHRGAVLPAVLLSIGGILVLCGFKTRIVSAALAIGWAWSACAGLLAGEDWVGLPYRSILFTILFAALALLGPGKCDAGEESPNSAGQCAG